jgi:membrane protein
VTGIRDEASISEIAPMPRERPAGPIARAGRVARRTLDWFPVRVWLNFIDNSGLLLAAGISYQALFAVFAAIYVAFAAAGIWLGASPAAVNALIDAINSYVSGLIGEHGLFKPEQVAEIARDARSVLAVTGALAIVVACWTATGFISFSRRAVRQIFTLPPDRRNMVVVKLRDFVAAVAVALALAAGFLIGSAGTWALGLVFTTLRVDAHSFWYPLAIGLASVAVSFAVYAVTLAALLRFLTRLALSWLIIRPGAILGAAGVTLLQLGGGYLLGLVPRNPLLATFAVFVGLLLWFQLVGVILLFAASWIAVLARDRRLPLLPPSEAELRAAEAEALLRAARERVQRARDAHGAARWWQQRQADRAVHAALDELIRIETVVRDPAWTPSAADRR